MTFFDVLIILSEIGVVWWFVSKELDATTDTWCGVLGRYMMSKVLMVSRLTLPVMIHRSLTGAGADRKGAVGKSLWAIGRCIAAMLPIIALFGGTIACLILAPKVVSPLFFLCDAILVMCAFIASFPIAAVLEDWLISIRSRDRF